MTWVPYTFNRRGNSGQPMALIPRPAADFDSQGIAVPVGAIDAHTAIKAAIPGLVFRTIDHPGEDSYTVLSERVLTGAEQGALTALFNSWQQAG
jgi:hypothetical protein